MITEQQTRVALIGIMVEQNSSAAQINKILHQFRAHIVGRMGLPDLKPNLSVISVVADAPENVISTLSGRLGMLPGVTTKTIYSRQEQAAERNG